MAQVFYSIAIYEVIPIFYNDYGDNDMKQKQEDYNCNLVTLIKVKLNWHVTETFYRRQHKMISSVCHGIA